MKQITSDPTSVPTVQRSLEVSQPSDRWEREADQVADTVMRMPAPELSTSRRWDGIQRCAGGCGGEDDREMTMRTVDGSSARSAISPKSQAAIGRLSGGQPMTAGQRSFFEPRFAHDFSQVRIHDSSRAGQAASAVNALAFTRGGNVAFAVGAYRPDSNSGRRLIAHELAHVVQQGVAPQLEEPR